MNFLLKNIINQKKIMVVIRLLLKVFIFGIICKNFLEIFHLGLFSEFLDTLKLFIKKHCITKMISFSPLNLVVSYIIIRKTNLIKKKKFMLKKILRTFSIIICVKFLIFFIKIIQSISIKILIFTFFWTMFKKDKKKYIELFQIIRKKIKIKLGYE